MVTINNAGNDDVQKTDLMKFADFKATVLANARSKTAQKILQYFQEQNLKDDDYVDLNKINLNQDEEISKDEWKALGIDISRREATKLDKALQAQRSSAHEKAVEEMNKMKERSKPYVFVEKDPTVYERLKHANTAAVKGAAIGALYGINNYIEQESTQE